MSSSLENLYKCADDVQDHFRRLGGSNQYSGFMNWHIPAFVLLLNQNNTVLNLLPLNILHGTKELQETTKSRLEDNPPSVGDIFEFIDKTTERTAKFKDKRESSEWLEFCKLFKV